MCSIDNRKDVLYGTDVSIVLSKIQDGCDLQFLPSHRKGPCLIFIDPFALLSLVRICLLNHISRKRLAVGDFDVQIALLNLQKLNGKVLEAQVQLATLYAHSRGYVLRRLQRSYSWRN